MTKQGETIMQRVYHAPPSVGSRLSGIVKPSWGKAKLRLASNPLKLTGDSRNFGFNPLGDHDLDAKNPYRRTHAVQMQELGRKDMRQLDKFCHKTNQAFAQ